VICKQARITKSVWYCEANAEYQENMLGNTKPFFGTVILGSCNKKLN
jgi:hypothetical protein